VKKALELLRPEGMAAFVKPGDKVALKVNMLMGKSPETLVTTHPSLVKAVGQMVADCGAEAFIIDSPGGPYTANSLRLAYERCGFSRAAEECGASLNYDTSVTKVSGRLGKGVFSAELLRPAVEADIIINLPKLKTHGLTTLTCAVKNMFGLIPGLVKLEYHMRSPKLEDFCAMLVDIAEMASPELTIVDAISAMQGEGPSGGDPKEMNLILAGENIHAIDYVSAWLMGIEPESVPTIAQAREKNLSPLAMEQIEIRGHRPSPSRFAMPKSRARTHILDQFLPRSVADKVASSLRPTPAFLPSVCTRCGICVRSCPPKALSERKGNVPELNTRDCIRCFCCQELCPEKAIEVRRSLLGRILFRRA
jgi:uncharacterized protein (DUF362 family)/Pyruvate/2-oxoacid:ferredoxin oxidoreductase delta subunit